MNQSGRSQGLEFMMRTVVGSIDWMKSALAVEGAVEAGERLELMFFGELDSPSDGKEPVIVMQFEVMLGGEDDPVITVYPDGTWERV